MRRAAVLLPAAACALLPPRAAAKVFTTKVDGKTVEIKDGDAMLERAKQRTAAEKAARRFEEAAAERAKAEAKVHRKAAAGDPAVQLMEWLSDAGGQVDSVELRAAAPGQPLRPVARRRVKKGDVLLRIPFSRRFGGDQLPPEAGRALRHLLSSGDGGLSSDAAAYLQNRGADAGVALGLLVERRRGKASRRRRWLDALPAPATLRSGLNFTEMERYCLYPDAAQHVSHLEASVAAFAEVAAAACATKALRKACGAAPPTEDEARWAVALTLQRARRARPAGDEADELVIFPVVDLMEPSGSGQVVPAGVFYDEGSGETTAVTFTVWRDVEAGEVLSLAPRGGVSLFHGAGLWGVVDDAFDAFPVQLTWGSMPAAAQRLLGAAGCGEEATSLILRNGTYPASLLNCLRIVAAFQQSGEERAAGMDFSAPEKLPDDVRLAVYDLLDGVLAKTGEKAEPPENCTEGAPGSALAGIERMNRRVVATMKAAADVMGREADDVVARMDEVMGNQPGTSRPAMTKDAYGMRAEVPEEVRWTQPPAAAGGGSDPGEL